MRGAASVTAVRAALPFDAQGGADASCILIRSFIPYLLRQIAAIILYVVQGAIRVAALNPFPVWICAICDNQSRRTAEWAWLIHILSLLYFS
jgi:hypothetical protein